MNGRTAKLIRKASLQLGVRPRQLRKTWNQTAWNKRAASRAEMLQITQK